MSWSENLESLAMAEWSPPCTLARSASQCFDETSPLRVCVIGGGIAGSTIALRLCEANRLNSLVAGRENGNNTIFNTTLRVFETGDSLVDGPPFCHLHPECVTPYLVATMENCYDTCVDADERGLWTDRETLLYDMHEIHDDLMQAVPPTVIRAWICVV